MWADRSALSGPEIATFVRRSIKDRVESIAVTVRALLDLGPRYKSGPRGDAIAVAIGGHIWVVPRPRHGVSMRHCICWHRPVLGGRDADGDRDVSPDQSIIVSREWRSRQAVRLVVPPSVFGPWLAA